MKYKLSHKLSSYEQANKSQSLYQGQHGQAPSDTVRRFGVGMWRAHLSPWHSRYQL